MNAKRILVSGVVMWIVGGALGWLTCGWLFNWVYKLPPNIWKDPASMMSARNMIGANLTGFVSAIVFAFVFALLYRGIPGKRATKGMIYGVLVWMVGTLPAIGSMPYYMTIATTVVVYWITQSLAVSVINGAIVGTIYREKTEKQEA